MADYWVKTVGGNDGDTGADFAHAFATFGQARTSLQASGIKGSKIRLVNDGTHVFPATSLDITNAALIGTSYTDPGFVIEGVDASGNSALVTCINTGVSAFRGLQIRAGVQYVVVRGLNMDLSGVDPTNGCLVFQERDATAGPMLFEACRFKGYADSTIGSSVRTLLDGNTTGPSDYGEIRYCVFENCLDPVGGTLGSTTKKLLFHHNVQMFTGDWINTFAGTMQLGTTPVNAGDNVGYYFNTVYINESASSTIASVFDWGPAAGDAGTFNCHSNYIWIDTTGSVTQVFAGGAGSTATNVGTIGFNTVRFGPNVVAGDNPSGLYEAPWDDGVDPKATDSAAYTTAAATVFKAPGSTWAWTNINGTGYSITLARDLRPLLNLTSSITGGVPGALPEPQTDYSVDVATSISAPFPDDTVILTITAANLGTDATSVIYAAPVPVGLTYISSVASAGSYVSGTGVWTIGSLVSGGTATLTITVTVDLDTGGDSIPFVASVTSGDPAVDPDLTNNTDTVTLMVQIEDEIDPGTIPYLDVAPIYAPVLRTEINASLYTKRNRIRHNEVRHDYDDTWREYTSRRITIAPLTTIQLISGIERAVYLVLESTGDVQLSLSLGDTNHFFPAAQRLAVLAGDFSIVKLTNPSASMAVDVLMTVID